MAEVYGTIWVCLCCMLSHANGECCNSEDHGGDGAEPLSRIGKRFGIAMGMGYGEHAEDCEQRTTGGNPSDGYECDCETNPYSTSQCEGCGSYLHGQREAMTLFKD